MRASVEHPGYRSAWESFRLAGARVRHIRCVRREYRARRDALASALGDRLGGRVTFTVPAGGIALWVHAPSIDVEAWAAAARSRRAVVITAASFALDGRPRPYLRLGFASLDVAELHEGAISGMLGARVRSVTAGERSGTVKIRSMACLTAARGCEGSCCRSDDPVLSAADH